MIHPPDKTNIESLRADRNGAWTCFRDVCVKTGDAGRQRFDSTQAAANVETLKQTVADHPWVTAAAAVAGTAIAVKLVRKLPIKSIGVTVLAAAARYYVPRLIEGYMNEKQRAREEQFRGTEFPPV